MGYEGYNFDSLLFELFMIVQSPHFKKDFDLEKAELIGEGNFAKVYKVFNPETQSYLAIRRVDRDLGQTDDIEKERTINEELKKVENEHILKIFDIIESEKCVWYITEFCEGGSLWDALNNCNDNKMNEKDALEVILQISKGVKELHNHRITHRDLKPENILLGTKYILNKPIPIIKLADFGLSTKKIIMETIAGTKEYIAPEQARFHNYTNAVDVWSLGIIFDEILHGSPFYVGDNNKEVFQKILKNPYKVRDESLRPSIQEFLVSVLKKKAYERPIIAVICQNIEKIMEEIEKERGESITKPMLMEKKQIKVLNDFRPPPLVMYNTSPTKDNDLALGEVTTELELGNSASNSSNNANQIISNKEQAKIENKANESSLNRSGALGRLGKRNEDREKEINKTKTPFKRQNGRPQLIRTDNEQLNGQISSQTSIQFLRESLPAPQVNRKEETGTTGMTGITGMTRDRRINQFVLTEPGIKTQSILEMEKDKDKINIYRVEKKKVQNMPAPKTAEQGFNIVDVKQYMESILKMKNQLLGCRIGIAREREFMPNAQLTVNEMPERIDGEEILKKFKKNYDYLNYVAYKPDYEIKLEIGSNCLSEQSELCKKELVEKKEKIKSGFLTQIDKFVDYYVQKILR